MAESNWRVAVCECCELPQRFRDVEGNTAKFCVHCYYHRGPSPENRLARAESHEKMLRERILAARDSEARATALARRAKERVAAALSSRGALAERIVNAAGSNDLMRIANDQKVQAWAQRHSARRDYEDENDWW